tara:strand:- start:542 stop:802 length:261 start_codon:yes stop_codon:yes gene_type:complete
VSFLKSAGFGLFSDKPNEAVVGFTHAASPTRIDESEETTKEKAEMAKKTLFLRPSLPLFFFFFSMVVFVFFIQIRSFVYFKNSVLL